jgi:hypothetical protein
MTVRASRPRVIGAVADLFDAMAIAAAVERGSLTPRDAKALVIGRPARRAARRGQSPAGPAAKGVAA